MHLKVYVCVWRHSQQGTDYNLAFYHKKLSFHISFRGHTVFKTGLPNFSNLDYGTRK